jgi:hypothetical protein
VELIIVKSANIDSDRICGISHVYILRLTSAAGVKSKLTSLCMYDPVNLVYVENSWHMKTSAFVSGCDIFPSYNKFWAIVVPAYRESALLPQQVY